MGNYLAITMLGEDRPELLENLARVIVDCKCNIQDSRMCVLGEARGVILLVQGNWNTLTRLESQLRRLAEEQGLQIGMLRTDGYREQTELRPYAIDVSALDQAGIVQKVVGFFNQRNIYIQELMTRNYQVPQTGALMTSVNLVVGVPAQMPIGLLREEFLDFCDESNWDAVLEPLK